MREYLRNGIPLDPQPGGYEFDTYPPQRTGDETIIRLDDGSWVHVQLLRGTGRKRWLVPVDTLRAYLRADQKRRLEAVLRGSINP